MGRYSAFFGSCQPLSTQKRPRNGGVFRSKTRAGIAKRAKKRGVSARYGASLMFRSRKSPQITTVSFLMETRNIIIAAAPGQ
jgi:hypothetical protein